MNSFRKQLGLDSEPLETGDFLLLGWTVTEAGEKTFSLSSVMYHESIGAMNEDQALGVEALV